MASKGTGAINLATNASPTNIQFVAEHVASATNYIAAAGSNGATPTLKSAGADTNINLRMQSKGTGFFFLATNSGAQIQLDVEHTASAVNNIRITGGATGSPGVVTASAVGSDTNIDFRIIAKGSGTLKTNSIAANGTVATVLTSLGPTGAQTTVQEWLAIKNNSGVQRYIPMF